MITEDYVSFETAKLLKEKGFDELCDKKYNGYKSIVPAGKMIELWQNSEFDDDEECSAPTLQMTMKWLREAHNIHIDINTNWAFKDDNFIVIGYMFNTHSAINSWYQDLVNYPTYEQACEAAIKYCLENLI